jgi:drug/metabolite transporter (DMT)-like permease
MDALTALASAIVTALYLTYISGIMKRLPEIPSIVVLSAGHGVAALAVVPMFFFSSLPPQQLWQETAIGIAGVGLLISLSRLLFYQAYSATYVSHVTVFSSLTPLYAIAIAALFYQSYPTHSQIAGIVITCASLYLFFYKSSSEQLLHLPFISIIRSKPLRLALLSTVPGAVAAVWQKHLLIQIDAIVFSFGLLVCVGSLTGLWAVYRHGSVNFLHGLKKLPLQFWLLSALLLPSMQLLFCYVLIEHHSAVALALQRMSMVFQILIAYLWLKERIDFIRSLLVTSLLVFAFGLLV